MGSGLSDLHFQKITLAPSWSPLRTALGSRRRQSSFFLAGGQRVEMVWERAIGWAMHWTWGRIEDAPTLATEMGRRVVEAGARSLMSCHLRAGASHDGEGPQTLRRRWGAWSPPPPKVSKLCPCPAQFLRGSDLISHALYSTSG